tara:strand:+ start:2229 stop:2912 length:684 start_codon:yes stop_codon:yes gene_type:complete
MVRLLCFHHAGGNAIAYRPWRTMLPDWIDVCPVQLPGRSGRMAEPAYLSMGPLVEEFTAAILPYCDLPLLLFGHSMGAAIAFAVAQRLEGKVAHLFVAGRCAPHLQALAALHRLSDAELQAYMRRLGGTPDIVFSEPELMAHVIEVLRADLALNDSYHAKGQLAATPITAFCGTDDTEVSEERLAAWSDLTGGPFKKVMLPGNHFFHFDAAPVLHRHIIASGERASE